MNNDNVLLYPIWYPNINVSNDGKPLITTISEISWYQFPYIRLPIDNNNMISTIVSIMIRPEIVILLLIFYLLSKQLLELYKYYIGFNSKSYLFYIMICFHNILLTIFSAIVAYHSWYIVLRHWYQYGFMSIYCDSSYNNDSISLWDSGLGSWSIIFYISKYYEFLDTWILILKNKKPSLLQIYHHTGIAFIMWIAIISHSSWLLFVVLFNSIIHTFMYLYFLIKTISPTTEIKVAKYLTTAQITQFFIGIICTFPLLVYHFPNNANNNNAVCISYSSRFALLCLHTYGFGLIALFINFANRKYKKS